MYIGEWHLSPLQSRHLGTSPSSPNCNQLPHRIFLNLINSLKSLSEVILVLGKGRSHRAPNLGWSGAESLGWFNVSQKNRAQDVMHEWAHCYDEAADHQLPIAEAFWITWTVSVEKCSSLMQNFMQICYYTCSVILNVTAIQYTCLLNSVYHPHWLEQWVIIVHTCAFQSTLLGCQVTSMMCKSFLLC